MTWSNIWRASTTRPKVEGPHFQGQKYKCIFEETVQKCLAIKDSDTWTDSSSRNNIWSSFSSTDLNIECCFSFFNCQTIEDQFLTWFFIGKDKPFSRLQILYETGPLSRQQKINFWLFPLQEKNQIICELPTHIEAHSWSQPDAAGRRWTNSACCTRLEPIYVFFLQFFCIFVVAFAIVNNHYCGDIVIVFDIFYWICKL